MDSNPNIGKWKRYPEKRELFEATCFVYFKSYQEIEVQVNLSPNSPLGTAYSVPVRLDEFKKFVYALKTGFQLQSISSNGFLSRTFKVKGRFTISETVYLWKIPVGYQLFTVSYQTANSLFNDFCKTKHNEPL